MSNSTVFGGSYVNVFDDKIEDEEKDEIIYGRRNGGKLGRRKDNVEHDDSRFKSKNLAAERRRRARLSSNMLHLRSLVPIITNAMILYFLYLSFSYTDKIEVNIYNVWLQMNKETIITDAITYIEVMQGEVDKLTELLEMEANSAPQVEIKTPEESQADKFQIQPEVKVMRIGGDKLYMKVIFEKRIGRVTEIMEAIHSFGYQMTDMSFSAIRGAATFTSCLEEMLGVFHSEEETRDMLLGIIGRA